MLSLLARVSALLLIASWPAITGARRVPAYLVGRDAISTVSDAEVATFGFYAQYAAASHCNSEVADGSIIKCFSDACPDVEASNATILGTFSGSSTDLHGFVAIDDVHTLIAVSFKGSSSIRNYLTDFVAFRFECDLVPGCQVHAGFSTAHSQIWDRVQALLAQATALRPNYQIIFTGHSLGGAVATLSAAYARLLGYSIDVYSYGSPRVGNEEFVKFVTEQVGAEYRVTHVSDPVPRLPPIVLGYRHTSPEYWLSTGTATTIDYTATDVKVCEGWANVDCNAGTFGLDGDAHVHYFEKIDACSEGLTWKRSLAIARDDTIPPEDDATLHITPDLATIVPPQISDAELLAQLNAFVREDRELAGSLE